MEIDSCLAGWIAGKAYVGCFVTDDWLFVLKLGHDS